MLQNPFAGINVGGPAPFSPAGLGDEIRRIVARWEAADRRAKKAATIQDREAAEAERRDAEGERLAAGLAVADLLLLLFRHGLRYRPEQLGLYVAEAMRPEIKPQADAIAALERRVSRLEGRRR
jgi:hypothetical protein